MANRLPYYLAIIAAVVYVAGKCLMLSKGASFDKGLTVAMWMELVKFIIVITMGAVSVYRLWQDHKSASVPTKPTIGVQRIPLLSERIRFFPKTLAVAFHRRPVLTLFVLLLFLAIPLALEAAAYGWSGITSKVWILIALAELPMIGLFVYALLVSWRSKREVVSRGGEPKSDRNL